MLRDQEARCSVVAENNPNNGNSRYWECLQRINVFFYAHPIFAHAVSSVEVPDTPGQYGIRVSLAENHEEPAIYPIRMEAEPLETKWIARLPDQGAASAAHCYASSTVRDSLHKLENPSEAVLRSFVNECQISIHTNHFTPCSPVQSGALLPYLKYLLGHRYIGASCLNDEINNQAGTWFVALDSPLGPIGVAKLHAAKAFPHVEDSPRLIFINYISTTPLFRHLGVASRMYSAIVKAMDTENDFLCRGAPAATTDAAGYQRRETWLASHFPQVKVVPHDLRQCIVQLLIDVPQLRSDSDGSCWKAALRFIRYTQAVQSQLPTSMAIDIAIARLSTLPRDKLLSMDI